MIEQPYILLDIETEGLDPFKHRLHGIAAGGTAPGSPEKPQYYDAANLPAWLIDGLADPLVVKLNHNLRAFDVNFLAHKGFKIEGPLWCTLVLAKVACLDTNEYGLKPLTAFLFNDPGFLYRKTALDDACKTAGVKHVGQLAALDIADPSRPYYDLIATYALEDYANTARLADYLIRRVKKMHDELIARGHAKTPWTYFLDEVVPTESLLLKMELAGVVTDRALIQQIRDEAMAQRTHELEQLHQLCSTEIGNIQQQLIRKVQATKKKADAIARVAANPAKYKCAFNVDSPAQVGQLVYKELGVPAALVKRTKTGGFSTKEDHLKLVASSIEPDSKLGLALAVYGSIKKSSKIIGTYTGDSDSGVIALLQERESQSWLFPNYKQTTATGRLACFPIQQLPRKGPIKRFFKPSKPDHVFVYADYSLLEMRQAAHLSQDSALKQIFINQEDVHIKTATGMYRIAAEQISKPQRDSAKPVNYLTIYGGEEGRLMQELTLKLRLKFTRKECAAFIRAFFTSYPEYEAYLKSIKQQLEETGYVDGENGRRRYLPDIFLGAYLDHDAKVFFGPAEMKERLRDSDDTDYVSPTELYWRARGRYKHALNAGYNFPNQTIGGTTMKNALHTLYRAGLPIRASIHDAAVVECHKFDAQDVATVVKQAMESAYPLTVPLIAEPKILNSFDETDVYIP